MPKKRASEKIKETKPSKSVKAKKDTIAKKQEKAKKGKNEEIKEQSEVLGKRKRNQPKTIEKIEDKADDTRFISMSSNSLKDNMQLVKKEGEKTLIEIIEDTKSGIPAKSEIETKEKKAFLKIKKRDEKVDGKNILPKGGAEVQSQSSIIAKQKPIASQMSCTSEQSQVLSQMNPPQSQISTKPKLVLVNGKIQIQAPVMNLLNRENALALANENREITVVNSSNYKLSSVSFMKRQPAEKWKPEETQKFFMALQIFGTDFSLIEKIFNGARSREQIKNKFRKEERKNKKHIDEVLKNTEGLTLKAFEDKYGKINIGEEVEEMSSEDSSSEEENSESEEESSSQGNSNDQSQSQSIMSSSKSSSEKINHSSLSQAITASKFNFSSSPFGKQSQPVSGQAKGNSPSQLFGKPAEIRNFSLKPF